MQSQYDKWQVLNILGSERRDDVQLYGGLLMDAMRRTILGRRDNRNGAYIDSCEHHGTSCVRMIKETYRFWSDSSAKVLEATVVPRLRSRIALMRAVGSYRMHLILARVAAYAPQNKYFIASMLYLLLFSRFS